MRDKEPANSRNLRRLARIAGQIVWAAGFAFVLGALAAGCGDSSGSPPQTGTQTGDEGDVPTPGAGCTPPCGANETCCSKQCVDVRTDSHNCGKCGNACGSGELCCSASTGASCSVSASGGVCPAH